MTADMAGWAVVQAHGLTLVGKVATDGLHELRPVYELKPQMQQTNGGLAVAHVALPVWLLGVDALTLPLDAIVVTCERLTRPQRAHLRAAVELAEQIQRQSRAEASGLVVAPAGTKLPPPPNGGGR
jgi:hypothetical protein